VNKNIFNDTVVIVFPSVYWSHNWERQHELIYRFAQKTDINLYIFPPLGYLNHSIQKVFEKFIYKINKKSASKETKNPISNNMHFINFDFYIPFHNFNLVRFLNKYILKFYIKFFRQKLYSELKTKKVIIWTVYSNDIILDFIDMIEPHFIIVDIAQRRKADKSLPEYVIKDEIELIKKSNVTFVDSLMTKNDYNDLTEINYFSQGVNIKRFLDMEKNKVPLLEKMKKPIIGYLGALHRWIDYDLLKYLIKNNSHLNFVFVGNIVSDEVEKIKEYKNVYLLGRKKFDELGTYLQYFDVGLVPYKVNDFTDGVSPTKLFEYGIFKIPVVSTNIKEVEKHSQIIRVSYSKIDFEQNIKSILNLKNKDLEKLKDKLFNLSKENSWENKFNYFFETIVKEYERK